MAWWLFQNVVVIAMLAGAVALVCRTTRIGPVARHALWVIVLIKFITPPVLVWPWAAPDPLGVAALDARPTSSIAAEPRTTDSIAVVAVSTIEPPSNLTVAATSMPASSRPSLNDVVAIAWPWLLALWILGSACMLAIEAIRLGRIARAVRRAVPGPPQIASRVGRLSRELGLRRISVITIDGQSSPAIWCVGRPRMLWPAAMSAGVTDACLDGLIVHELAHVQRRDHLVGWIELIAGVIWWWNPLFWYVRSALREQAELACDAWVISALPNGRRAYAESLLALSSAAVQGRSPTIAAVIGIRANNRRVLERRLVMIMQGRASLRLSVAGLVALVVMALASLPAWATASQQTAAPPAAVTQQPPQPPQPPQPAQPTTVTPTAAPPAIPVPVQVTRPVTAPPPPPATSALKTTTRAPVAAPPAHQVAVVPTRAATTPSTPVLVTPSHAVVAQQSLAPVAAKPSWVLGPQGSVQLPARTMRLAREPELPADGQEVLKKFEADRDAIQEEADKKIEARRADLVKALQVLQDQYTKAGKLDEAVAIRDYIKAGAGASNFGWIKRR